MSDNGTCFVSAEFKAFLVNNGIRHITSAPYHPSSNGLAERAVQIVKKGLRKVTQGSIQSRLAKILFMYRLTPQSTTNVSPSELLLGKRPRSRLDLIKPHTAERVERKQLSQKKQHDLKSSVRSLQVGDPVFVRNYRSRVKWLPGEIHEKTGPVSFKVKLVDGRIRRCHQDQIRKRTVEVHPRSTSEESDTTPSVVPGILVPELSDPRPTSESAGVANPALESSDSPIETDPPVETTPAATPPRSYPRRNRASVTRFEPTW